MTSVDAIVQRWRELSDDDFYAMANRYYYWGDGHPVTPLNREVFIASQQYRAIRDIEFRELMGLRLGLSGERDEAIGNGGVSCQAMPELVSRHRDAPSTTRAQMDADTEQSRRFGCVAFVLFPFVISAILCLASVSVRTKLG